MALFFHPAAEPEDFVRDVGGDVADDSDEATMKVLSDGAGVGAGLGRGVGVGFGVGVGV